MKEVNQDEALSEIFDGENVYVRVNGNVNLWGDEPIEIVDDIEYARLCSHEEVESETEQLYIR